MTNDAKHLCFALVYSSYFYTCIAVVKTDCFLLEMQFLQRQTRVILTRPCLSALKLTLLQGQTAGVFFVGLNVPALKHFSANCFVIPT